MQSEMTNKINSLIIVVHTFTKSKKVKEFRCHRFQSSVVDVISVFWLMI